MNSFIKYGVHHSKDTEVLSTPLRWPGYGITLCKFIMWNFPAVSPEITDDHWIFGDN